MQHWLVGMVKGALTHALTCRGDATPLGSFFFLDARRSLSRIVLKFSVVFGATFAQLLVKMTGSCQVTKL